MENNVVTLDTAKKLKAAGFPQETLFCWYTGKGMSSNQVVPAQGTSDLNKRYPDFYFAAPTAQEIADQLPLAHQVSKRKGGEFVASEYTGISVVGPTMAEALAALWIKLQVEGGDSDGH